METTQTQSGRRRPLGVTIIAILEGIQAIILILVGIFGLLALSAPTSAFAAQGGTDPAMIKVIIGVIGGFSLVVGLLSFVFTWGLWTLKRWAFWLTIIFQIISLLGSVAQLVQTRANTSSTITGMVIPIILLLYFLIDSNVRAAFRV